MHEQGARIDLMGRVGDELPFFANAVMPPQFYPPRRGSASVEPIMRLMGAVLIDAVRCFQRNFEAHHKNGRQEFKEAQFWLFYDNEDGPFLSDLCATP
jgi:hypothetical protein